MFSKDGKKVKKLYLKYSDSTLEFYYFFSIFFRQIAFASNFIIQIKFSSIQA